MQTWLLGRSEADVDSFIAVPTSVVLNAPQLGLSAQHLGLILAIQTNARPGRLPWPSVSTLATRLSVSERTVFGWLHELRDRGLLTITHRYRAGGMQTSSALDFAPLFHQAEALAAQARVEASTAAPTPAPCTDAPARPEVGCRAGVQPAAAEQHDRTDDSKQTTAAPAVAVALRQELEDQGVSSHMAARLVGEHPPEAIRQQLDALAQRIAAGRAPRSPAGWLIAAVRDQYTTSPACDTDPGRAEYTAWQARCAAQRQQREAEQARARAQSPEARAAGMAQVAAALGRIGRLPT